MKKELVSKLGFNLKDSSAGIYFKKYSDNTIIEVDFIKETFHFGGKIKIHDKDSQKITKPEDWVVLECVDRLLEKGYKGEDIILENSWKTGHQTSGRIDILVLKNGKSFLMIECKTWGKEFEKEFKNMQRDGGQLFTYFQQDRNAEFLVLYTSNIDLGTKFNSKTDYTNEIVKVEEHYKETTSVVDFYDRWNKLTKQNGIFEDWIAAYNFESRALTKKDLKPIKQKDASIIFNSFLEILRKNTVSDKPNAFNKIFTLFLCKIYDEGDKRDDEELSFQWIEGKDNHIDFQLKLTDLYKKGMQKLLEKEVTDLSNDEFNNKFGGLSEAIRIELLKEFNKIRLEKNNEFAIKDVFDKETFEENAIVLKEVVELLQVYQIRYEEKQPFLGDFFELLLTTGLKQEAGQFFTPVPVARFICKSIPINKIIKEKLEKGDNKDLLPSIIDYAAGSGHFLTESMGEIQTILKNIPKDNLKPDVAKKIKAWDGNFDWAYDYMYGIEKDYRLVKTAKVGCFLHGDGIANVIHGDGLDSFGASKYRGKLKIEGHNSKENKDNGNFDLVLSNPPYSVGAFKSNLKEYAKDDFELFSKLTEQSSEIEALFIERTSQLLREGGIAGIILPSSILSNTGIYTKAREIILKDFDIIAITELGSNTFMATGTNTVTLFLRKRNKYFARNLKLSTDNFFINFHDVTLNQIEKAVSKYVGEVWEGLKFEDYISLVKMNPNENIVNHEIFKDYKNKIKLTKKLEEDKKKELLEKIIEIEKEKLFYFVLTYYQKLVLVKSGEKNIEKEFLGYEFSNRKGSEGIHPIQRGKQIDDCTKLYDVEKLDNPEKASTYIYDSFDNNHEREIDESLVDHIFRTNLVDLLTFDRVDFEKTISTNIKKKVRIESKWEIVKLSDILETLESGNRPKGGVGEYREGVPSLGGEHIGLSGEVKLGNIKYVPEEFFQKSEKGILKDQDILICKDGALTGKVALFEKEKFTFENLMINEHVFLLRTNEKCLQKYLFDFLFGKDGQFLLKGSITGQAQGGLNRENLFNIKIPLPPKDIQEKIVSEITILEKEEQEKKEKVEVLKNEIEKIIGGIEGENEIIKNISILNPSKKEIANINENTVVSFIEMASVSNYGFVEKKVDMKILELKQGSYTYFREGDIIIAKITPCMENGKCAIVDGLTNGLGMGSSEFHVIRCNEKVINKLLFTFLNRQLIRKNAEEQMTGASGHRRVPISFYENIKIPLPSLEIQKQVVSQIEEIEKEIEILESELKQIPEKKKEILKKYL